MSLSNIGTDRLNGSGIVKDRALRILGYFNTIIDYVNATLGGTTGAALIGVLDALGRYAGGTVEACLAEAAGAGRVATDTIRSGRLANVDTVTATSNLTQNHVVVRDAGGNIEVGTGTSTDVVLGVNNYGATILAAASGDIVVGGEATVTCGPQAIAIDTRLAEGPGGVVVAFQDSETSLMGGVTGVAPDDWANGLFLPAGEVAVINTAVAGDEGKVITIYGLSPAGAIVNDAITLDAVDSQANPVTGVVPFVSIWYITAGAALTQNLVVDTAAGAHVITNAMAVTGAGPWGAVLTDLSDNALGHAVEIRASAAHAGHVIAVGTDGAGAAQYEDITLNGTNWVRTTRAWNTFTHVWTGEDGTATPRFHARVPADSAGMYVGEAKAALTAGTTGSAQIAPHEGHAVNLLRDNLVGTGRKAADTIRSARKEGIYEFTATSAVANNLVVQRDAAGNYEVGDGTGIFVGVNNSGATILAGETGDAVCQGDLTVTAGAGQNIAVQAKLASSPGGKVVAFVAADHSLMSAVADIGTSDWNSGVLDPAGEVVEVSTDVDHANNRNVAITVWGQAVGGAIVSEVITTNAGDSTTPAVGAQAFISIWSVSAASAIEGGTNLLISDVAHNAIITAGMACTGAGPWGVVLTDDSDLAYGHRVQVKAAAAHAGHVIIVGTNAAGAAQYEDVTLNGTNWVTSTNYWNTVTALWTGEDGVATPTLSIQVAADPEYAFVGYADAAIAANATGSAVRI